MNPGGSSGGIAEGGIPVGTPGRIPKGSVGIPEIVPRPIAVGTSRIIMGGIL